MPDVSDTLALRLTWGEVLNEQLVRIQTRLKVQPSFPADVCQFTILMVLKYTPQRFHSLLQFGDIYRALLIVVGDDGDAAWRKRLYNELLRLRARQNNTSLPTQ